MTRAISRLRAARSFLGRRKDHSHERGSHSTLKGQPRTGRRRSYRNSGGKFALLTSFLYSHGLIKTTFPVIPCHTPPSSHPSMENYPGADLTTEQLLDALSRRVEQQRSIYDRNIKNRTSDPWCVMEILLTVGHSALTSNQRFSNKKRSSPSSYTKLARCVLL